METTTFEENSKKVTLIIFLITIVLWPIWIFFDFLYAPEKIIEFASIRIFCCLFTTVGYFLLVRNVISNKAGQYLLTIPALIAICYMINVVNSESLSTYFVGASLVIVVIFGFLILPFKRGITMLIFSIAPIIVFQLITGNSTLYEIAREGGFVYASIGLFGVGFSTVRYNDQLDGIKKNLIIDRQKNDLHLAIQERDMYLAEMQHRVKNNLQMMLSLVNLQRNNIGIKSSEEILMSIQTKIKSISTLHDLLFKTDSQESILLSEYINTLVKHYNEFFKLDNHNITLTLEAEDFEIDLKKILPCGLVINEIVTNSIQHAFEGRSAGKIKISLKKDREGAMLTIEDNGIGMDDTTKAKTDRKHLGLTLINGLSKQIGGTANCTSTLGNGTKYKINFKF